MILRAAGNLDRSEGWVEAVSSHFLTLKRSSSKLAIKKLPTNEQLCALCLLEFVIAQESVLVFGHGTKGKQSTET